MPIETINKCMYCKRAKSTHKAKMGQLEVNVCKKCGEKLIKNMDAKLIEIELFQQGQE